MIILINWFRNTLILYKEAATDILGMQRTLPHWHWVDKFLREIVPSVVTELEEENPHGIKLAGTCTNGLALTFSPSAPHRDRNG